MLCCPWDRLFLFCLLENVNIQTVIKHQRPSQWPRQWPASQLRSCIALVPLDFYKLNSFLASLFAIFVSFVIEVFTCRDVKTADIQTKTSVISYETRLWAEEQQSSGGPISRLVNHITIAVALNPAALCFIFQQLQSWTGREDNNFSIFWGSGREAHLNKLLINLP